MDSFVGYFFSAVDSFFTAMDGFVTPVNSKNEQHDCPVDMDTSGGGNNNCVIA